MAIENIGDTNRVNINPKHGLTVRCYDGAVVRIFRHDDNAPRNYGPYANEGRPDVRVHVKNSTKSPSAVDIHIVYDVSDFEDGDLNHTCDRLERQFGTRVTWDEDERDPRNKRVISFTMWKDNGRHGMPFDWLLHVLDVTLPPTISARRLGDREHARMACAAAQSDWAQARRDGWAA